jgi:hypothetical protein
MTDLKERIKEPFEAVLDSQFSQLEAAAQELEARQELVKTWEEPRGNIRHRVLPLFRRWAETLKRLENPFSNAKAFKKEKQRLKRAAFLPRFHWRALLKRGQMLLMGAAFIFIKLPLIAAWKIIFTISMFLFSFLMRILPVGVWLLFLYLVYKFVLFLK